MRTEVVRRSGLSDRRGFANEEKHFVAVCLEAGAKYRGIQTGHGTIQALVLFDDPRHATPLGLPTLAVEINSFSLTAVREKLSEAEAKWRNDGSLKG